MMGRGILAPEQWANWVIMGNDTYSVPSHSPVLVELRERISQSIRQAVRDEQERCAEIAWKMQQEQFGGGTAIGNEIQKRV